MLRRYPKTRRTRVITPRPATGSRQPYDTDLTDEQWEMIKPLLTTKDSDTDHRAVLDAILYRLRTGCAWRLLPHDFPRWGTVYDIYRLWRQDGTIDRVHDTLRRRVRIATGHSPEPSAAIIDSQSVKVADQAGIRGYDAGKKVNGRKRHLLVDTLGLILVAIVHSAGVQDYDGARWVLGRAKHDYPTVRKVWADSIYSRRGNIAWVSKECGCILEIVVRNDKEPRFRVVKRRWVVERTFGWLGKYRCLSKDYEVLTSTSEANIKTCMINLMVRRLSRRSADQVYKTKDGDAYAA
jgi:putative transposase